MKPQIKIVNVETGDEVIRDANADEIVEIEARQQLGAIRQNEENAKAAARQAILDRLGLTEEEARLLLG